MTLAELRPIIQSNLDQMEAANERYALRPEHSEYMVSQTRQHIKQIRDFLLDVDWVLAESLRTMQTEMDSMREELAKLRILVVLYNLQPMAALSLDTLQMYMDTVKLTTS